jgi:hypothetical protein
MDDQEGQVQPVASEAERPKRPDSPAQWAYERIARQIVAFEDKLSDNEEIGLPLVGAPKTGVMHIKDIGYWGPDMLIYHGKNDHGKPMELLQHYTQMNVLLTAVPKIQAKPNRIGFHLIEKIESTE